MRTVQLAICENLVKKQKNIHTRIRTHTHTVQLQRFDASWGSCLSANSTYMFLVGLLFVWWLVLNKFYLKCISKMPRSTHTFTHMNVTHIYTHTHTFECASRCVLDSWIAEGYTKNNTVTLTCGHILHNQLVGQFCFPISVLLFFTSCSIVFSYQVFGNQGKKMKVGQYAKYAEQSILERRDGQKCNGIFEY